MMLHWRGTKTLASTDRLEKGRAKRKKFLKKRGLLAQKINPDSPTWPLCRRFLTQAKTKVNV